MNVRSDSGRILLVYESAMFRHGIARSLSDCEDLEVVADVGTIEEARRFLESAEIDAIILGVGLPDGSGFDLARYIKSTYPKVKVVLLSASDDEETFLAAVRIDADGYVLDSSPYEQFLRIMESVLAGECSYDPAVCSPAIRRLVNGHCCPAEPAPSQIDCAGLSCRERQVVELMSKGMTNKEIANELAISMSTTKTHISRIFKQLGISYRRELLPRFLVIGGVGSG